MYTTQDTEADRITRKHTAFSSYDEMAAAIARGYVPTVSKRRQPSLLRLLQTMQLPVFEVR